MDFSDEKLLKSIVKAAAAANLDLLFQIPVKIVGNKIISSKIKNRQPCTEWNGKKNCKIYRFSSKFSKDIITIDDTIAVLTEHFAYMHRAKQGQSEHKCVSALTSIQ